MSKLPVISGLKIIKALKRDGFVIRGQEGSHVFLAKPLEIGRRTVTVPKHRVLAKGTLLSILKQAGWSREDLQKNLK